MNGLLKAWRNLHELTQTEAGGLLHPKVNKAQWCYWEKGRRPVPPGRVWALHKLTGIAPHKLRPDIFPAPDDQAH
jgi:DNA-binding transcriptional regulator YdaS (Cro superfamily)